MKVYLAVTWLAAKAPFEVEPSARQWAELLALDEPGSLGKRRVSAAIRHLERLRLISVKRRRGHSPTITLLREDGSGKKYGSIPSTDYVRAKVEDRQRYVQISDMLWREGHLQAMSMAAVAALIVILDEHRGDYAKPVWWAGNLLEDRYGIKRAVFSRGTQELRARGLIHISRRRIESYSFGDEQRMRNTYQVIGDAIPPTSGASSRALRSSVAKATRAPIRQRVAEPKQSAPTTSQ